MPDATERKILVMCTFVATCIALAPQEWVSAGTLGVLSILLFSANVGITRREEGLLRLLDQWVPPPSPPAPPEAEAPPAHPIEGEPAAQQSA